MTGNIFSIGVCELEFTPHGGEKVSIGKTLKEDETKLVTETEITKIETDQDSGPVSELISGITATLTATLPYNQELIAKLNSMWKTGSEGISLSGDMKETVRGKLVIKPLRAVEGTEKELIAPNASCKIDLSIDYKKVGLSKMPVVFTLSSDVDSASETFGQILVSGNYKK